MVPYLNAVEVPHALVNLEGLLLSVLEDERHLSFFEVDFATTALVLITSTSSMPLSDATDCGCTRVRGEIMPTKTRANQLGLTFIRSPFQRSGVASRATAAVPPRSPLWLSSYTASLGISIWSSKNGVN